MSENPLMAHAWQRLAGCPIVVSEHARTHQPRKAEDFSWWEKARIVLEELWSRRIDAWLCDWPFPLVERQEAHPSILQMGDTFYMHPEIWEELKAHDANFKATEIDPSAKVRLASL